MYPRNTHKLMCKHKWITKKEDETYVRRCVKCKKQFYVTKANYDKYLEQFFK
jgi:hypothetical protein